MTIAKDQAALCPYARDFSDQRICPYTDGMDCRANDAQALDCPWNDPADTEALRLMLLRPALRAWLAGGRL